MRSSQTGTSQLELRHHGREEMGSKKILELSLLFAMISTARHTILRKSPKSLLAANSLISSLRKPSELNRMIGRLNAAGF
jgi:hypothetical protein